MHQPEPSGEPARVPAQRPEVCQPGLTKCQARTRLYRGGELVAQGFPVADISDHLAGDESALIWLDLLNPDRDEDQLFAQVPPDMAVQRRSFELRRSLVLLRRVTIPMREVVNTLMHHDLRAAEWTDSLRDLVTSILETNLTIQGNRMNVISKKVTGWAAIIAVPTFITGFYGMNVPYPGFSAEWGFVIALGVMIVSMIVLYRVFRRRDWL
jgi:Mg2+ and Co2+ transporter CorA